MSSDKTDIPLLQTKLHKPPVVTDHLLRQQLLDHLNRHRQRPLTLVLAPAGYGKSTLVSYWLDTCGTPGGWISLDESDNDLRSFTAYLIAAVQRLFPGACRRTQIMINSPNLPPLKRLRSTLINELDQIESPCIIVLDDYHLIDETAVHDLMTELLKNTPQSLHLVIIGRRDPLLPISALRAKSLVTEIRTRDLCLNHLETAEFLRILLHQRIDSKIAAALREKTEGWITGLHLAAISLRRMDHPEPKLLEAHSEAHYVMEYLFDEAYARQSPVIRQYLLGCAILDRFCASLCEAVCLPETEMLSSKLTGGEYIAWLQKENLFLIPLDAENRWFRLHHLFRKLLLEQLTHRYNSEEINALHARASAWYADEGLITEAIRHALAAGDETGAAQLVVQNRLAVLDNEKWFVLEKWLSMLPDAIIRKQPELLMAQAWIHHYHYNYGFIPPILDAIGSLLHHQQAEDLLYGEIYYFKAVFCLSQGKDAESLTLLENSIERIPETQNFMRGSAELHFAIAAQMQGQKERAVHLLTDLLQNRQLGNARKVRVLYALVFVYILSGNLSVAFTLNQQLKTFAASINSTHYIARSSYFSGLIHYCRNELDLSLDHLGKGAELSGAVTTRLNVDCMAALALTYQAAHQTDKAGATLEHLAEFVRFLNNPALLNIVYSCKMHLSLMKEKASLSQGPVSKKKVLHEKTIYFFLEVPTLTHCRVLIEDGSEASLQEAENILLKLLRLCESQRNTFQMIFIMPFLALAYEKQSRRDKALTVLEEAVNMACPGGFVRPFVEAGPDLKTPLKQLAEKNVAVAYIGRILAAVAPTDRQTSSVALTLDGHLTNREYDILELLAKRLRNKEIAEKLFISAHTVNTHLKNIYRKLDAKSRIEAVARAKDLGLL